MNPRRQRAVALAVSLGVGLSAMCACRPQQVRDVGKPASPEPSPSRLTSPTPRPGAIPRPTATPVVPDSHDLLAGADPTDPTAVGAVFARDSWSFDTAAVPSEAAAEAQLSALMTPSLAAEIPADGQALPTSTFSLWRAHHATTTVQVVATHDSGAPADTATTSYRSFAVTVTPLAGDGWVGAPFLDVEFLTLSRPGPGGAWRIAQVS